MDVLRLALAPDHEAIRPGESTRVGVVVEVRAQGAPLEAARPPLAVCFVLDASRSMKGAPLEHALASVEAMLPLLEPRDRVGVVAFSERATLVSDVLAATPETRGVLRSRLARVRADAGTNVESGLLTGAAALRDMLPPAPDARKVLLLLSDGEPNRGSAVTAESLRALARSLRKDTAVATLGYGPHHHEDVLSAVADGGGGTYRFVPDPRAARADFARVLGAQGDVVADGLELLVQPEPGVEIARVLGARDARFSGAGLRVSLPDAFSGDVLRVGFELDVRAPGNAVLASLVRATLAYRLAGRRDTLEVHAEAACEVAARGLRAAAEGTRGMLLLGAEEARHEARTHADRGQWEGAAAVLRAFLARITAAPGFVQGEASPLGEAYEQLLDEAMAYERKPSAEAYGAFRKAQSEYDVARTSLRPGGRGAELERSLALAAGPVPRAHLEVIEGPGLGARMRLGPLVALGRSMDCEAPLPSAQVSRRHAEVFALGGNFFIRDLGSTNPTEVNGERLVAGQPRPLLPRDRIRVGDVVLRYDVEGPTP
jgi:Ca-activated chloride channel family protein